MKQLVQNRINGFRQRHLVSLHKLVYPVLHKTIHPDDAATKHIETDLTNHQIFFFTPTPPPIPIPIPIYIYSHAADPFAPSMNPAFARACRPVQRRRRNEAHDDPQTTKLFGRSRKLPGATKYGWTTVCKIEWVGLDNDTNVII